MDKKPTLLQYLMGESFVDNSAAHAKAASQQQLIDLVRNSIGTNETSVVRGDPYSSFQDSGAPRLGRALGKYRVTEGELKTYAPIYYGSPISGDQFLKDPKLQDAYVNKKISYYLGKGYTPQQVADIHNKGYAHEGAPGSTTYQSPDYVGKFNATFKQPPS